ncbi:MAG: hypothetical protein ACKVU1_07335 [bacterium]
MNVPYEFIVAVPGLTSTPPIEAEETLFVGRNDPRYKAIIAREKPVETFLRRFNSPLGKRLSPVIIARRVASRRLSTSALTGFRNAIAVQSVLKQRIAAWHGTPGSDVTFVDPFDIYPAGPGRGHYLQYSTPMARGLDKIHALRGQPGLGVFHPDWNVVDQDDELLAALMCVWKWRARHIADVSFRERVMRSLEMAYLGLRAPMIQMTSRNDLGIALTAWVAAFETLAHPGDEKVGFKHVSTLIKEVKWHSSNLRRPRFVSGSGHPGKTTKPVQVYGRLWVERSHALHGAPIPRKESRHRRTVFRELLLFQAPCLYRSVLLHVLSRCGHGTFPAKDLSRTIRIAPRLQEAYEAPLVGSRARSKLAFLL